ncbi:MAG: putative (cytosine-5-)-methyltransferase [Verrucomicrobia bacterium]|nr:putative (cytosine-5-)-methyltransferase [Verrucomicrobiota bacterium]
MIALTKSSREPARQATFLFPETIECRQRRNAFRRRRTTEPVGNSYFSGAGLFDLGLRRGGVRIQQSFELDETCCATLRRNFTHDVVQTDLSHALAKHSRECDFMAFTHPCTKYSPVANLHQTRTGDDLYLHALRQTVLKRPEVYVHENVPGMKKFAVVMEAITELPDYYVTVFCPVQACTWLPQKRDRLIAFGSRRPFAWRPPEQSRAVTLQEILDESPDVQIPDYVYHRLRGQYRDRPIISDPLSGDLAPTCVAHYGQDMSTRLVRDVRFPEGVRPYTVREYARLQGVPVDFEFSGTTAQQYRQIGNGVAVPVGEWAGREIRRYFAA